MAPKRQRLSRDPNAGRPFDPMPRAIRAVNFLVPLPLLKFCGKLPYTTDCSLIFHWGLVCISEIASAMEFACLPSRTTEEVDLQRKPLPAISAGFG